MQLDDVQLNSSTDVVPSVESFDLFALSIPKNSLIKADSSVLQRVGGYCEELMRSKEWQLVLRIDGHLIMIMQETVYK